MTDTNRCIVMARRPAPGPVPASTWRVEQQPVPVLAEGEVLVRVDYVDVQPAMRSWLNERPAYTAPIAEGEVMRAQGVGQIIASRRPGFVVGEHVHAGLGVQSYCVVRDQPLTRLDLSQAALPAYLSALGSSGMTAYFGLLDVGQIARGETVVVSSAAGAVGSVAGQIARLHGCKTVGIAGGPDKCRYLTEELGFDGAVDYKRGNLHAELAALCPEGIDVYFDNVGGDTLDVALLLLKKRARVVISGMLSQYNTITPGAGPRFYGMLLVRHARMEGFLAADYLERYPEARSKIAGWLQSGELRAREQILDGVDAFPDAFSRLFDGRSLGKVLLRVQTP
jgi:NADPH-dependent curcumin reductase CurA